VVICPSNPFVSVDPLLALPGMRDALRNAPAPVVAVSPIVGGSAIKGPDRENDARARPTRHGRTRWPSTTAICSTDSSRHPGCALAAGIGVPTVVTQTVMLTLRDRIDLAESVLEFIDSLR
jgi:LPPG:FO 2-phospho-L-lactate transferase